jgi:hypothetical protein
MGSQYLYNWEKQANPFRNDPIYETLLGSISYHIFNDIFPENSNSPKHSYASPSPSKSTTNEQ